MRVLALSPHTDDADLGAGGTLARWAEEGREVWTVAFSTAMRSELEDEFRAAADTLGIQPGNVIVYNFPHHIFPSQRQAILQHMIALRDKLQPDLVLGPSLRDVHQDHWTVANEMLRAFKMASILSYELPWNNLNFETLVFAKLNREHLDQKLKALRCYQGQRLKTYFNEDFIEGLARTRGTQIQTTYAEAFEVIRWIL